MKSFRIPAVLGAVAVLGLTTTAAFAAPTQAASRGQTSVSSTQTARNQSRRHHRQERRAQPAASSSTATKKK